MPNNNCMINVIYSAVFNCAKEFNSEWNFDCMVLYVHDTQLLKCL